MALVSEQDWIDGVWRGWFAPHSILDASFREDEGNLMEVEGVLLELRSYTA